MDFRSVFIFIVAMVSHGYGQQFELLTPQQSGVTFVNRLQESPKENIITYEYFYNGGGVAAGDFNNDGKTDLIFTSNQEAAKIYLNEGGLRFKDITQQSGINTHKGWKTGIALADVNNDGWLDIYISYSGNYSKNNRRNKLFINQKDLTFKEQAKSYGIDDFGYTSQSAFFDYDKDGDLDLFVLNHNTKLFRNFDAAYAKKQVDEDAGDRLYENRGGRFVNVTLSAGILSNPIGYGLGIEITDINNDGWPDMYVSNDYVEEDYLYINNQDGTFSNELKTQMPCISNFSMGVDSGDLNNDGFVDLVTLDMLPKDNERQKLLYAPDNFELYNNMVNNGFHHQAMRNMLQRNNGDGTFSDVGQLAGISNTDWSWAPLLADFNNDGLQDLYITNGYGRDMINRDVVKFYMDERLKYIEGKSDKKMFEVLKGIPSTPLQNYFYLNQGALRFKDATDTFGLTGTDFSHGAIYSDLDNDGDLELVVNVMNGPAKIFKNLTRERNPATNYLSVSLRQPHHNTFAVGARVQLFTSDGKQLLRELHPTHGFQSALMEPLHFGLGTQQVDSIRVTWNDTTTQLLRGPILMNRQLEITKAGTQPKLAMDTPPVFEVAYDTLGYTHKELLVNDFKVQPLLPYMISFHGPKIKPIDLNKDGLDDLFIPGPEGQSPAILLQTIDGKFFKVRQPYLEQSSSYEDSNATFFDADGDGDLDLYIVSGGFGAADAGIALEDRLYKNTRGVFVPVKELPKDNLVGSVAVPWDYDQDGDLDLFVGTRVQQSQFPKAAASLLLHNNGQGNFTPVAAPLLAQLGRVTDAAVEDFNGDGQAELLVVGDWTTPKIINYSGGNFVDQSNSYFNEALAGWWNVIRIADLDQDGDPDFILGNWGTNNQFKPSAEEPMELYYADFDNNGYIDPVWCYYVDGVSYPHVLRDELTDQIVGLRKKFVTYASYANTTMQDIFSPAQLAVAPKCTTNFLETVWFENTNGSFRRRNLPVQANVSSVNAIVVEDFDQDGYQDIFLAGNTPFDRVRIGKRQASYGVYLKGTAAGQFSYLPNWKTKLSIQGSVRSLETITTKEGKKLLAGINNQKPLLLTLKKHE